MTNISVMSLILWKAWYVRMLHSHGCHAQIRKYDLRTVRELRDALKEVLHQRRVNKVFTLFVLLVESGTLYVIMLVS